MYSFNSYENLSNNQDNDDQNTYLSSFQRVLVDPYSTINNFGSFTPINSFFQANTNSFCTLGEINSKATDNQTQDIFNHKVQADSTNIKKDVNEKIKIRQRRLNKKKLLPGYNTTKHDETAPDINTECTQTYFTSLLKSWRKGFANKLN